MPGSLCRNEFLPTPFVTISMLPLLPSEQQELLRLDAVDLTFSRRHLGTNGVLEEKSLVLAQ
jgi:hypothetical protein